MDGLRFVGLDKIFLSNQVYSFDMVQKPKPDPDIYLKVLNDNSLNIEETIIIEDSGVGVKAGYFSRSKGIWANSRKTLAFK